MLAAQNNLGLLYANGKGVAQDYGTAFKWYEKAAMQGFVIAQVNLAELYEEGLGVARNPALARKWYENAALEGNENAKAALQRLGK